MPLRPGNRTFKHDSGDSVCVLKGKDATLSLSRSLRRTVSGRVDRAIPDSLFVLQAGQEHMVRGMELSGRTTSRMHAANASECFHECFVRRNCYQFTFKAPLRNGTAAQLRPLCLHKPEDAVLLAMPQGRTRHRVAWSGKVR